MARALLFLKVQGNGNKNENFSRPAAQGGLHRDSQGSSLKDRDSLWVSDFSEFWKSYEVNSSQIKKLFKQKSFLLAPGCTPESFVKIGPRLGVF